MASLLRQIVAGPRSRHPEAGLDLCYVTPTVIATSGPSGTYPQRAYRNPLDQLVTFLDYKHGKEGWMIWEFRAEGTGYPDEEVRGRVKHWPWPDHHPPPFKLVPGIVGGMRNWLEGKGDGEGKDGKEGGKVVVVHCKAGKGRSGTMACSYLIAECGWKASEALARFTERRMRPGFGQGVSIPSQLRWIGYVDRWTASGKHYIDRQIEIMEVHVWGLRDGVKVQVEGYVDEGKTIKLFHVFTKKERVVVEGNTPGSGGIKNLLSDMAGFGIQDKIAISKNSDRIEEPKNTKPIPQASEPNASESETDTETGGGAVIFKPSTRVILPTSDVNIDFERRNKASMGWTMVTAVAHVWFNAYFEGDGLENNGKVAESGIFEIEWDKMDGIKGSSRKGTRALDKLAVVWKVYDPEPGHGKSESIIEEPDVNAPVPEVQAADWKGDNEISPTHGDRDLGLRTESPVSAEISKASSINEADKEKEEERKNEEEGLRVSSPTGEEDLELDIANLPNREKNDSVPTMEALNKGLDTATSTTPNRDVDARK
ncbi:23986594-a2fa-47f1-8343-1ee109d05004 [Sclerotinia trifoliorum]|uniref:phosphatidylinositol-3,4,5-trisphosphate 3-phosphatase n=1 Tax=Sclerotinia trifoliorum TaxID=28548 RepID=A0A8H2VKU3_9HELO|nr:23986594-a2fa-47f1-8343-1ee109d05004 [Sclerotinia trifoliorum]